MMTRREQENFQVRFRSGIQLTATAMLDQHITSLFKTFLQLIVITHDEKFAHLIGTRENTEVMWRITKDEQQHTHIEAEVVP